MSNLGPSTCVLPFNTTFASEGVLKAAIAVHAEVIDVSFCNSDDVHAIRLTAQRHDNSADIFFLCPCNIGARVSNIGLLVVHQTLFMVHTESYELLLNNNNNNSNDDDDDDDDDARGQQAVPMTTLFVSSLDNFRLACAPFDPSTLVVNCRAQRHIAKGQRMTKFRMWVTQDCVFEDRPSLRFLVRVPTHQCDDAIPLGEDILRNPVCHVFEDTAHRAASSVRKRKLSQCNQVVPKKAKPAAEVSQAEAAAAAVEKAAAEA